MEQQHLAPKSILEREVGKDGGRRALAGVPFVNNKSYGSLLSLIKFARQVFNICELIFVYMKISYRVDLKSDMHICRE